MTTDERPAAVIGIDTASSAGWAVFLLDGTLVESGTWDLSTEGTDFAGDRWRVFETNLRALLERHRVVAVAIERPVLWGEMQWSTARVLFGQAAMAEAVCARYCVRSVLVQPADIKMRTAGNGRASKTDVIEAVVAETGKLSTEPGGSSRSERSRREKLRSDEADARGAALVLLSQYTLDGLERGELEKTIAAQYREHDAKKKRERRRARAKKKRGDG